MASTIATVTAIASIATCVLLAEHWPKLRSTKERELGAQEADAFGARVCPLTGATP